MNRAHAATARKEAEEAAAEVGRLEAGLREVRGKLEQRRNDSNSQQSQNVISQALLQAKASGEIPGIYGRLGRHKLLQPGFLPPKVIRGFHGLGLLPSHVSPHKYLRQTPFPSLHDSSFVRSYCVSWEALVLDQSFTEMLENC